jgi:hypothetical protein
MKHIIERMKQILEAKQQWSKIPPLVILDDDIFFHDLIEKITEDDRQVVHDHNYFFGSALQHHKHPDAKKYHAMSQRSKTTYRKFFERRLKLSQKHKLRDKEIFETYQKLVSVASLGG